MADGSRESERIGGVRGEIVHVGEAGRFRFMAELRASRDALDMDYRASNNVCLGSCDGRTQVGDVSTSRITWEQKGS